MSQAPIRTVFAVAFAASALSWSLIGCGGGAGPSPPPPGPSPPPPPPAVTPLFSEEASQHKVDDAGQSFAVAFADVDSDGNLDMFVTNSNSSNRLYLNSIGNGDFTDATLSSGLEDKTGASRGAVFADVNDDGLLDLYVADATASNHLYIGDGKGHFTDTTAKAGVGDVGMGQAACFADVDNDGDLDLYVANFGTSDNLYLNDGKGVFANATDFAGLQSPGVDGFACTFGDVDEDGDLDLYVSNAGSFNKLYINDGKGVFTDNTEKAGVAGNIGQGRGVSFADLNGDGHLDLFMVGPMVKNQLFLGDGTGVFTDGTDAAGVGDTPLAQGMAVADVDGDGDLDIFISNILKSNTLYENDGTGHFKDVSAEAKVGSNIWGGGIAGGDINGDGALDLYVANFGPAPGFCPTCQKENLLLMNQVKVASWLKVRPVRSQVNVPVENGFATLLGAEVRLFEAGTRKPASVRMQIDGGSGFASQKSYDAYFGLSTAVAGGATKFDIEMRCGADWITKAGNSALAAVTINQVVTAVCANHKTIV